MSRVRVTPGVFVTPQRLTNVALLTLFGGVVGTVQQYYQEGPRRISAAAVKRIDEVTGVGAWVAARDEPGGGEDLIEASGLESITRDDHPRTYIIPVFPIKCIPILRHCDIYNEKSRSGDGPRKKAAMGLRRSSNPKSVINALSFSVELPVAPSQ